MKRKQQFIANTFLLTAVSLFMRAVGVSFNAYIANRIGAAGMGLFSLVMSVYNFGVTFACSGIGLASTRLVSEELAIGGEAGVKRAVKRACTYGLIFGLAALFLIFFCAPFAGETLLGDARTVQPLRILSLSLPCVAMSAAISGYFSAVGRVGKSALVQVLEQLIRVSGCVVLLNSFGSRDAGIACKAVVASGSAAEVISFLLLFLLYRRDIRRYQKAKSGKDITRRMLKISLPVAVSAYLRSALSTIEHTMIPKGLQKHGGDSETALAAYGTVHGMVLPLILFPSAVLQAFSTMLIPEVTMHHKRGERGKINSLIERALYTTLVFSIGASGILFFFAEEIGMAMYKSTEAAHFIKLIAPLAVIMYADGVVDAVLKGLNQQVYSMGYNVIDSAVAIVLMLFLLPARGINGYVMIIYITEMVNAFLSVNRLLTISDFQFRPVRWAVVPSVCIFVSCFFIRSMGLKGIFAAVCAVVVYGAVMLVFMAGDRVKCALQKNALYDKMMCNT